MSVANVSVTCISLLPKYYVNTSIEQNTLQYIQRKSSASLLLAPTANQAWITKYGCQRHVHLALHRHLPRQNDSETLMAGQQPRDPAMEVTLHY